MITADCDGQHTVEDIRRMGQAMEEHPDSLILGARKASRQKAGWGIS